MEQKKIIVYYFFNPKCTRREQPLKTVPHTTTKTILAFSDLRTVRGQKKTTRMDIVFQFPSFFPPTGAAFRDTPPWVKRRLFPFPLPSPPMQFFSGGLCVCKVRKRIVEKRKERKRKAHTGEKKGNRCSKNLITRGNVRT